MFYMAYGILEHGVYFVDALWGQTDLLKEWSVITNMLLDATELSQAEESFLIELLTCSAMRVSGASPPPGRIHKKLILAKEKKQKSSVSINTSTRRQISLYTIDMQHISVSRIKN